MLHRYDLVKNFPNGDRYRGEATECNVKDGKGTFTWGSTGATYTGEWKKDAMHGRGVWRVPDPVDGFVYDGTFANGARHGVGGCHFHNGRVYRGAWVHNAMHDPCGVLEGGPADAFSTYTGPFEASMQHGACGTMQYRNGDVYHGAWHAGMRHGRGRFESPMAHPLVAWYEGTFDNDVCCGEGRVSFRDGTMYDGQHNDMVPHGPGLRVSAGPQGASYLGEFCRGLRHGRGALETSAFRYDGEWVDDVRQGLGEYWRLPPNDQPQPTTMDGAATHPKTVQHYRGAWHSDAMSGRGKNVVAFTNGCTYEGDMSDNQPHGHGSLCNEIILLEQRHRQDDTTGHVACNARLNYSGDVQFGVPHGSGEGRWVADSAAEAVADHWEAPTPQLWLSPHGASFAGTWREGLPHGTGRFTYAGGASYEGPVFRGFPHGESGGTFTWPAPTVTTPNDRPQHHVYQGGFDTGRREHQGRLQYANGDVYDGGWHMDARSGHGTFYHSATGDNYTGAWRDDRFHGEGKQIVYGKAFYHGGFVCGKRHGRGTLTLTNGSLRYDGDFANDAFEGQGTLVLPAAGLKHTGSFSNGQCHGVVQTAHDNGNVYHGAYTNGETHGEGEMRYVNGDWYVGSFASEERRHGRGVFYFSEGTTLECSWAYNVLHGTGKHTDANGRVSTRTYVDGTLVVQDDAEADHDGAPPLVSTEPDVAPTRATLEDDGSAIVQHPTELDPEGGKDDAETGGGGDGGGTRSPSTDALPAVHLTNSPLTSPPRAVPLSLMRQMRGINAPASGTSTRTVLSTEGRIQQLTQSVANLNLSIQSCELSATDDNIKKRLELLRASRIKEVRTLLRLLSAPAPIEPPTTSV